MKAGGTWWRSLLGQFRFPVAPLEFVIDIILPAALCPWGGLSPNRYEYQQYFMEVKVAGA